MGWHQAMGRVAYWAMSIEEQHYKWDTTPEARLSNNYQANQQVILSSRIPLLHLLFIFFL